MDLEQVDDSSKTLEKTSEKLEDLNIIGIFYLVQLLCVLFNK